MRRHELAAVVPGACAAIPSLSPAAFIGGWQPAELLTFKQDRLQGDAFACRPDSLRADLLEAETFMESTGGRIWWVDVVLAGDEARSAAPCKCKEVFIEDLADAAALHGSGHHDPIDIAVPSQALVAGPQSI